MRRTIVSFEGDSQGEVSEGYSTWSVLGPVTDHVRMNLHPLTRTSGKKRGKK